MEAELLFKDKYVYKDGAIREMILWRLPAHDPERSHGLKYRLYYGYPGQCLVRYDNERGKGDHRHYIDDNGIEREERVSVQQLVGDFSADIEKLRGALDE